MGYVIGEILNRQAVGKEWSKEVYVCKCGIIGFPLINTNRKLSFYTVRTGKWYEERDQLDATQ
jgi:hypothetical protein